MERDQANPFQREKCALTKEESYAWYYMCMRVVYGDLARDVSHILARTDVPCPPHYCDLVQQRVQRMWR